MSYYIICNNISNLDIGVDIVKRPIIPIPTRRYKEIEIEGHDGKYYKDEETYDDITFPIEFNFAENDLNNIRRKVKKIIKWLKNIKDNKLILSDNKQYYYKVCKVDIDSISYEEIYEIQKFTVNFTVDPYQYVIENEELILSTEMLNNWDVSKPIYRITGTGNCIFNVNGHVVNCTVNNTLIIDTQHDKILNADKTLAIGKTDIKKMQDLYLQEEENIFSWTNGFTIYITPNWRTI